MGYAAADHVTPETEPTCTIAVLDFSHTKDVHGVAAVSSSTSIAGRLCRLPPKLSRERLEEEEPPIALSFEQRLRVLPLVRAMLAEISIN